MRLRFFSLSVFLIFFLSKSYSQDTLSHLPQNDTLLAAAISDTFLIRAFEDFNFNKTTSFQTLGINLDLNHRFNPAVRNLNLTSGNIGLAHQPLVFRPNDETGFRFWRNHFSYWEIHPEDIKHYQTRVPYTEVELIVGSKNLQYFKGHHTQNISQNWNFGFNFNKNRSDGFYRNQNVDFTNAAFQTSFLSENKRYGVLAKGFFNDNKYRENGGLGEEIVENVDSQLLEVNLSSASARRNNRGFVIKQYFNSSTMIDSSAIKDSIIVKNYSANDGFFHEVSFNDYRYRYSDENIDDNYYLNFPSIDTLPTLDSIQYLNVINCVGWGKYHKRLNYSIWLRHQYGDVFNNHTYPDRVLHNYSIGGRVGGSSDNGFSYSIGSSYLFSGYHRGDYSVSGNLDKEWLNNSIGLSAFVNSSSPELITDHYFSKHIRWENQFSNTRNFSTRAYYFNKPLKLNCIISFSSIYNYLYFDNFSQPSQFNGVVNIPQIKLEKTFRFYNLRLLSEFIYQRNSQRNIIRIPEIITRNALFYEFGKKEEMKLQIGGDLLYYSNFYSYNYMPVISQFYLQNQSKHGDYPFLDLFVNVRIKQVRAFVKITHINQGFLDKSYMGINQYPFNPRAFRVGINWIFFN